MEIERKWLLKHGVDLNSILKQSIRKDNIKDYYANPFTRMRIQNGEAVLTIKSQPGLVRDEFNMRLTNNQVDIFTATFPQCLEKDRYYITYLSRIYEVGVFKDLTNPRVLIELELTTPMEELQLPPWVGLEVTGDINYYGYHLFQKKSSS